MSNDVVSLSYLLLLPVLYIFAKSASSAIEPILHALFVPTPFKQKVTVGKDNKGPLEDSQPEEVLQPGAITFFCNMVRGARVGYYAIFLSCIFRVFEPLAGVGRIVPT